MRRIALLGLTLLLPACQTLVGSPVAGAGGFIADTHTYHLNPNRPAGDAPNMLRSEGRNAEQEPLTPEPGNVWPGPSAPEPTLQDIQREQNQSEMIEPPPSRPAPPAGSTSGGSAPGSAAPPSARFYPVPGGAAVGTSLGNGVQTYTDPKGGTGIVVPNGNGTSTLIGPDGSVSSVPTPR
jgi:hypothetical protein